jgi:hypothetical protein
MWAAPLLVSAKAHPKTQYAVHEIDPLQHGTLDPQQL